MGTPKEKIIVICRYDKWCDSWFNALIRFLAYNVYSNDRSVMRINKRHRCLCLPDKEIWMVSRAREKEVISRSVASKVIYWGDDRNDEIINLWNQI